MLATSLQRGKDVLGGEPCLTMLEEAETSAWRWSTGAGSDQVECCGGVVMNCGIDRAGTVLMGEELGVYRPGGQVVGVFGRSERLGRWKYGCASTVEQATLLRVHYESMS